MSQPRYTCKDYTAEGTVPGASQFALQGSTSVCYENVVYVFGGLRDGVCMQEIVTFDLSTKEISQIPVSNAPPARHGHASCLVGGLFYVFGGVGQDGNFLRDLWAFNLEEQIWEEQICKWAQDGIAYHCMAQCSENELLIGCGMLETGRFNQGYYIYKFADLSLQEIQAQGERPTPVVGAVMVASPRGIYIIGGKTFEGECIADVWHFANRRFQRVNSNKPMISVAFHSAALVDEQNIIVFGGIHTASEKATVQDFQNFLIETKQWRTITPADENRRPARRERCIIAPYRTDKARTKLLICGGADEYGVELSDMCVITFADCYGSVLNPANAAVIDSQAANSAGGAAGAAGAIAELEELGETFAQKSDEVLARLETSAQQLLSVSQGLGSSGEGAAGADVAGATDSGGAGSRPAGAIKTTKTADFGATDATDTASAGETVEAAIEQIEQEEQRTAAKCEEFEQILAKLAPEQLRDLVNQQENLLAETETASIAEAIQRVVEQSASFGAARGAIFDKLEEMEQMQAEITAEIRNKAEQVENSLMVKFQAAVDQVANRIAENQAETMEMFKNLQIGLRIIQSQYEAVKETMDKIEAKEMNKTVRFDEENDGEKLVSSAINTNVDENISPVPCKNELDIEQLEGLANSMDEVCLRLKEGKPMNSHIKSEHSDYSLIALGENKIAASNGKIIDFFDSATLLAIETKSFDNEVTCIAFNGAVNDKLIIGFSDGLLEVGSRAVRADVESGISCICLSQDSIYAGTDRGSVVRVKLGDLNPEVIYHAPESCGAALKITALNFCRASLVIGDETGTVRRLNLSGNSDQAELLYTHEDIVSGAAILPDHIISVSHDKTMRIWRQEGGKQQICDQKQMEFTAVTSAGDLSISADRNGLLRIWKMGVKARCLRSLRFGRAIEAMRFNGGVFLLIIEGTLYHVSLE